MFHFFTFESTPFKFLKHGVVVSPFKLSFNPLRLKELASCSLPCAASSPPVDSLGCNTCHKIKFDQISGARGVAQSHNFQEKVTWFSCSHCTWQGGPQLPSRESTSLLFRFRSLSFSFQPFAICCCWSSS